MTWIADCVAIACVLALALRRKLRSDAIWQGGVRVGSALLAEYARPGAQTARFAIVRGEPKFQERLAFTHRARDYEIVSWDLYDDRSTVLRRFLGVACRVVR